MKPPRPAILALASVLCPLLSACAGDPLPTAGSAAAVGKDWPMWGGSPSRNPVNTVERGIPAEWDIEKGTNIKWSADIGSRSYGNPVVASGKVFVGTNNDGERDPSVKGDRGVVMCFREADGSFLWQAVHEKLASGRENDYPEEGICSSPCVVGDRIYYVSNRCELVCADIEGFLDGENDGPFKEEKTSRPADADFVWILDMIGGLSVFPHNMSTCSPLVVRDVVYIHTSNGVNEAHEKLPSPEAPSFIAVDARTGKVVWKDASPGAGILHGQWSCPALGIAGGREQVVFPGGDGWLYAFDPPTGKLLWKFDGNPKDAKYEIDGRGTRNQFVATPVFEGGRISIGMGDDPEFGDGVGHLYAIDPAPAFAPGAAVPFDLTGKGAVWHVGGKEFRRTISTVAVCDGLVYAPTLSGFLHCFDAATGKPVWTHDLFASIWGSPLVVDGKVYLGNEDGDVTVFRAGRELKVLAKNAMESAVYGTAVAARGVLFVASRSKIFAIAGKP